MEETKDVVRAYKGGEPEMETRVSTIDFRAGT